MSLIAKETVDSIFHTVDIVDVANQLGLDLKKSGSNFKCKSPWVDEKTPSCIISPAKQIFKDFSSGRGGTALTLLMERESLDYPNALKWVADLYNIEVKYEEESEEEIEKRNTKEELLKMMEAARAQYVTALRELHEEHPARIYIDKRFTQDEQLQWGIGYAPEGFDFLTKKLKAKGLIDSGKACGLLKETNGKTFDFYRNRVMIPILNGRGRVVSFGGRALDPQDIKKAKYLNGPDTEIYTKSKILFGLNFATKKIHQEGFVYLVEGYTDVTTQHHFEVENTIATCGTALCADHIKAISRFTNHVVCLRDGDKAGISATMKDIELLTKNGFKVDVVPLPPGEDPDSYARKFSAGKIEMEVAA